MEAVEQLETELKCLLIKRDGLLLAIDILKKKQELKPQKLSNRDSEIYNYIANSPVAPKHSDIKAKFNIGTSTSFNSIQRLINLGLINRIKYRYYTVSST